MMKMELMDVVTVVGVTMGFLGFVAWIVNFIVSRSEGRINAKFTEAKDANEKAHEGITTNIKQVSTEVKEVSTDVKEINTFLRNHYAGESKQRDE